MSKTLTLSDGVFAKLAWLKNRYEALENGRSLTWGSFLEKVAEDNILILSYKFHKKLPGMPFNDVMVFLLGGFMSIDEVRRDNANNEVLRLFQGKLGNPVGKEPLGGGNNTEKTREES